MKFSTLIFQKNKEKNHEIAIVDRNASRETSWDEFRTRVLKVASYAADQGIGGIVPVCMERGMEAAATILGLNMAGVAVAPLAANTPAERIKTIAEQTNSAVWTEATYQQAQECGPDSVFCPENGGQDAMDSRLSGADDEGKPAYVVFTSGSTGTPKGVVLNNRAIIEAITRVSSPAFFDYQPDSRTMQMGSLSFIAFVVDMMSPLYAGCTVYVLPEESKGDCGKITDFINRHAITETYMPPQLYRIFEGAPSLRCVYTGTDKIINLGPKGSCKLKSGYGLSETAGPFLTYEIKEPMKDTPIGRIDDSYQAIRMVILDEEGNPSDEGELCLSGAVALEYLNSPEKNAASFVPNPFSDDAAFRVLFKTGDIVKKQPDGTLLFVSRKDHMLKINGQRVEPGEIELTMLDYPGIGLAVVKGFSDEDGRSILCAYYTCAEPIDEQALKAFLSSRLNGYMVPSAFVRMESMPVNTNGKIDRKALQKPDFAVFRNEYHAPETELEARLCDAFAKVLGIEKVGIEDDFFSLGGDSIRAMEVSRCIGDGSVTAGDILLGRTPKAIERLAGRKSDVPFSAGEGPDCVPLTESQMGIYLQCTRRPESVMYNLPMRLTYQRKEGLTAADAKQAVDSVLRLHSALYAHLKADEAGIMMCRDSFPAEGIGSVEESAELLSAEEERDFVRPFDLFRGPLCRALIRLSSDKVVLYFDCHHIVADGASATLLVEQFGDALAAKPVSGEALDAFCVYGMEEAERTEEKKANDKAYFDALLGDSVVDSRLIYDGQPDSGASFDTETAECALSLPGLSAYLQRTSLTESSFFMGVFGYTLAKMAGLDKCLFGAVESGRKEAGTANTVSMFVRTVPVLYRLDETKTASDFLRDGQLRFFHTLEHDAYPFSRLVSEYGISADTLFVYEGTMLSGGQPNGETAEIRRIPVPEGFADLAVSVWKSGTTFTVSAQYRKACYRNTTVDRFLGLFETVAECFLKNSVLKDIPLLSDGDRALLDGLNQTESGYEKDLTMVDLFRRSAQQCPDKTVVVCGEKRYTYREADEITDRIAAYLFSHGIGKGQTVSVLIPRCEYMLLASIGILKAGAVYQPLDPNYPAERLAYMCKDAESGLLIADRSLLSLLPDYKGTILCLDECETLPRGTYDGHLTPDDPFVLLYTSGTTGLPKGCKLLHRNVTAFVHAFRTFYDIDETYVGGVYASYGFDAHLSEIYPPLAVCGSMHIIREDIRLDLPALKEYFEKNGITHTVMTTQVARQFACEYPAVKGLRSILCGGEKLADVTPPDTYLLSNGYGPTEATVMITCFKLDKAYANIPVGKALPNVRLYVQDAYGRRVPVGVPGELVVFGAQVADGYLHLPEKSAEVFVQNTFDPHAPEAYRNGYRTGDIVRILGDGNLEIFGRRDSQVKIRGFRIELSEVESVIREYPDVRDATVIARDDPAGGKCIHAYVVSDTQVNIHDLNRFIAERKPSYMVPKATMQIEAIPLTPSLKVDKRKLPPITPSVPAESGNAPSRPMTELEARLFDMVAEIVGHRQFSVETDFALAGIASITSIRLSVRILKEFGLHINARDLLDGNNILTVENAIVRMLLSRGEATREASPALRDSYPLTQTQLGIYTDSLAFGTETYLIPLLLELKAGFSTEKLKKAIAQAVAAHPSMRCAVYPDSDGTPFVHPTPDLAVSVEEETADHLAFEPTHFTFTNAPLFRFRLFHVREKHYLLTEVHHIIGDGESLRILMEDIAAAYGGKTPETESFTAFDMAAEEEHMRQGKEAEEAGAYYDSVFRGVSADYLPCPDRYEERSSGECDFDFAPGKEEVLRFCAAAGVSENVFFCGAFALTLARFTSHTDALFSTIHNGRGDPRTERLFAMTVKTIPLYININGEDTPEAFLRALDERLKKLKKYDGCSFADAARRYGLSADPMFVYQGNLMQTNPLGTSQPVQNGASPKTALSVEVTAGENGYAAHAEYDAGRYSASWTEGFLDALNRCVSELMAKSRMKEISVCSPGALREFADFNHTEWPIPQQPAYRLFENSVDRHPEKLAVVAGEERLTYRELDNMANELARRLLSSGLPGESTVVLLLDRTKEIYVSEIGTLKSGNVFLCLSPEYPLDRIRFIMEDSAAGAIVTTHAMAEKRADVIRSANIPVFYADEIDCSVSSARLNLAISPESLAYLIYTSGSTGKPKGVMVKQKGLVTVADANPKNTMTVCYVNDDSVSAAVSAFTFDASVMEGVVALANGSTVCIASEAQIHDPEKFCRYCLQNHVSSICATPSFLINLSDCEDFKAVAAGLRAVLAGGEEFTSGLCKRLFELNPNLCVLNGYGPSEATIGCSCKQLKPGERITIGTPLANTKLYCLDGYNQILPMGALGELVIVGDAVGKGYLNRPDLTEKAFITLQGNSAFKTGDLAVITHGGEIEFHGRVDNQVKIRGLRVELGEIEAAINAIDGVKSSVVLVKGEGEQKTLVAFFTADRRIDSEDIIAALSARLASYMIPRNFMQLDEMPMTANGKVDKRALPDVMKQRQKRHSGNAATATEKMLCELFGSVLQLEEVLPEDDFFAIGGNSLSASRVIMQLKSKGYRVEYQTIFDYKTPKAMAAVLDAAGNQSAEKNQGDTVSSGSVTDQPYQNVLQYNALPFADRAQRTPLGDVVLTGAAGFLGIHVLRDLLENEEGHVCCLIRKGSFSSTAERLNAISCYYFDENLLEQYADRITVLETDITSEKLAEEMDGVSFSTIINCAASVKHFAADRSIEHVNVCGVENLIALAKARNARLIQISTTSVAGVHTKESLQRGTVLHENQLFMLDGMDNQYILSKYQAEQRMLEAIQGGMRGKIIRVGNLMGRHSDGVFQINMGTNSFMNTLKGFAVIGKSPVSHCTDPMEFSPVDCTARAIVLLAGTNDDFTLFHANNRQSFDEMRLIEACNRAGVAIAPTADKAYYEEYTRLLGDPAVNSHLAALITNDRPDLVAVTVDNRFTANVLYRLGFAWPVTDDSYLDNVVSFLRDMLFLPDGSC